VIRRLLAAALRRIPLDPNPQPSVLDVLDGQSAPLSVAEAARMVRESWAPDALPTRTPGAALNAAVARYVTAGMPLYPDDELYVTESGAIVHTHTFTAEETAR
jgi:hypothetical protein